MYTVIARNDQGCQTGIERTDNQFDTTEDAKRAARREFGRGWNIEIYETNEYGDRIVVVDHFRTK